MDGRSLLEAMGRVPGIRDGARRARSAWWSLRSPMAYPPGHFYSPIPSRYEVDKRAEAIFAVPESVAGIDLRSQSQLRLVDELRAYHHDQPFGPEPPATGGYHFENPFFGYGDAIVLHCMLRHLRPDRVIEVGSGYSSAVILDTNDGFLDGALHCTLIDPYPQRLASVVGDPARRGARVITSRLQDVELTVFDELAAGDVLFVDSSHVVKVGSDVQLLILEVLPRLRPGVVVHFHDVFYPFEYPRDWIARGLSWNEAYMLRAFLAFNADFEIVLFNSYLAAHHRAVVAGALPLWSRDPGSSLWIRRVDRRG